VKRVRHLFWDFDGTMYDSYPQISRAFLRGLEALGLDGLITPEQLRTLLKHSVFATCEWCAQRSGADAHAILESYHAYHSQEWDFPPYEGLADTLKTLRDNGFHHYLYTHRDEVAVEQLKRDGLWTLFEDAVIATDGFPHKPAPDALLALMTRNSLSADTCAMIGDRDLDIRAGHNAGMSGILFDPDGFYPDEPVEMRCASLPELAHKLIGA